MNSKVSSPNAWVSRSKTWLKPVVQACPVILLAFLAIVVGLMPSILKAQSFYGSIVGTVTDATGAAVPGATVTVTNLGTNDKRSMQTGAVGEYRFVNLVPANYKVEVQAKSFKRFEQLSVMVHVDDTVRVDAQLQVGAATETVEVSTQPPLLQTDSGAIGSQVQGKVVQEMPLNGRNTMNLLALVPGVVPQGSTAGSPVENSGGSHTINVAWDNYQIGGGIAMLGSTYIDGAPDNTLYRNAVGLIPTQDAVQEFKVATNAVSAEFGRFGGGVMEMTTKSGSNAIHGSLYEYLRQTDLNANPFFSNNTGSPRAAFHQDQYGVTAAGPIKKNKAFFFFSWEKFMLHTATPSPTNVPGDGTHGTTNMRGGIFADTLSGKTRTISDPVYVASGGTKGCNITHDSVAGTYTIPTTCFDTTSKIMMNYYPGPNATPTTSSPYNYNATPLNGSNMKQYDGRIDYNLSDKQRIFGRYTYWSSADISTDEFKDANGYKTNYANATNITHAVVLGDTYTLNPTTIADVRLSYMREAYRNMGPGVGNTNLSAFGTAYAALASQVTYQALPNLLWSGSDSLYKIRPMSGTENDQYNTYALDASLTKIMANHTFKFGGEVRLMERNGIGNFPYPSSMATYANTIAGDEFAAFLLGEFTTDLIETVIPTTTFNYSEALYGTDTWQVNRKLTLNLGMRWELPGGMSEKKDRTSVLLPSTADPNTGYMGTIALVNSSLYSSRSMEPTHYAYLDPRVSFAQRLDNSTVVRGGYGIMFVSPDLPSGVMAFYSPVAAAVTTDVNALANPSYFQANPYPSGILEPVGRTVSTWSKSLVGQVVQGPLPTDNYPYMQQWNLSLSRQWKGDWLTEAAYVGAKGTNMPMNGSYNSGYNTMGLDEIPSQDYTHSVVNSSGVITTVGGVATTGADAGLSITAPAVNSINAACAAWAAAVGKSPTVGQCLRPYPQYQDYQNAADYSGSTTYHALQITVTKRFGSGGVLNANYTWSKMIGDTDSVEAYDLEGGSAAGIGNAAYMQDFTNRKAERSIFSFDVPQRAVISYVLDLPFGKGQKFAANLGGPVNAVISGWSVNGITTFQDGFYEKISYNGNALTNNFGAGTLRPNYVSGCNKSGSGSPYQRFKNKAWFNAACFTTPGNFAYGNEQRVDPGIRQQGIDNWDFSVLKATKVKELADIQFRAEFFNIFNHPQLAGPGGMMAGSNFNIINAQNNSPRLVQVSLRVNF